MELAEKFDNRTRPGFKLYAYKKKYQRGNQMKSKFASSPRSAESDK